MPGPLVAEPERWQDVHLGRFWATVVDGDLDQYVVGGSFGILHEHVEIPILIEHPRIDQFVLEFVPAPAAAGLDQVIVRKGRLRIFVEILHVRVGRRAIEVEVILLDILPMIAFAVGQPKQAFLEDRILAIPQGQREAEPLLVVGNTGQTILAPTIGARARLIVAEIIPGITTFAIVLTHRAPLALTQVRAPFFPRNLLLLRFFESDVFCRHRAPSFGLKG